jgi:hypothetical protein
MISIDLRRKGFVGRVRIEKPTRWEVVAAIVVTAGALGVVWLVVQ